MDKAAQVMINFAWPWAFFLLPLPYLIYRLLPAYQKMPIPLYMPMLSQHHFHTVNESDQKKTRAQMVLMTLLWLFFILALANPEKLGAPIELPSSGRDLLLAVDISRSMEEHDMTIAGRRTDRLTATKNVLNDFLSKRKGDRVGLILYGTNAYIQAPLTFDLDTVKEFLNESQLGFAGDGTAIGDAIGIGIKKLEDTPEAHRTMILLSDGVNNTGAVKPLEAARFAKQSGIKIYTVALGRPQSRYPLDERTLNAIADITGAAFFRARNTQELENIYDAINRLEPIDQKAEVFRPKQALFYWPLGFMFLLFLIISLLDRFPAVFNNRLLNKKAPHG